MSSTTGLHEIAAQLRDPQVAELTALALLLEQAPDVPADDAVFPILVKCVQLSGHDKHRLNLALALLADREAEVTTEDVEDLGDLDDAIECARAEWRSKEAWQ